MSGGPGGRRAQFGGAGRPWSAARKSGHAPSAAERALHERRLPELSVPPPPPRRPAVWGWVRQDGQGGGLGAPAIRALLVGLGIQKGISFPLYAAPVLVAADIVNAGPRAGRPQQVGHYTPDAVLLVNVPGHPSRYVAVEVKGRMDPAVPMLMRLFLACYGHEISLHVVPGRVRDVLRYDPARWEPARLTQGGRLARQIGSVLT